MNREEAKRKVIEHRKAKLAKQKADLESKAEVFKRWPGKALKVGAILVVILSVLLLIDGFLKPTYKSYKIHDAQSEVFHVMSQDGYGVYARYFHVYLDEARDFEVVMYMYEYYLAKYSDQVEVGASPIFSIPRRFRVEAGDMKEDKALEFNVGLYRGLPVFLIILGMAVLFMNFKYNSQTLAFGRLSLVVIPAVLIILLYLTVGSSLMGGQYVMDISDLEPKNRETIDEVKALSGIED